LVRLNPVLVLSALLLLDLADSVALLKLSIGSEAQIFAVGEAGEGVLQELVLVAQLPPQLAFHRNAKGQGALLQRRP
jgi:hypothetical protein